MLAQARVRVEQALHDFFATTPALNREKYPILGQSRLQAKGPTTVPGEEIGCFCDRAQFLQSLGLLLLPRFLERHKMRLEKMLVRTLENLRRCQRMEIHFLPVGPHHERVAAGRGQESQLNLRQVRLVNRSTGQKP